MTNANAARRMIAPIQCVIGMPQLAASFVFAGTCKFWVLAPFDPFKAGPVPFEFEGGPF
jgi:hypothetical protein